FVRETTLLAQAFDPQRLEGTGDVLPVVDPVAVNAAVQRAILAVSSNGGLAYQGGPLTGVIPLRWFDRTGKPLGSIGEPAAYLFPRLSPDGKRLVAQILDLRTGNSDLWVYDPERGIKTRFTFEP